MLTRNTTFTLVVDYDRPHEDGIVAGNFQVVNLDEKGVTNWRSFDDGVGHVVKNQYPTLQGKKRVTFRYFHFGRWIFPEEVIAEMEKEGCRPAVLKELLAVVEQRSELQEPKKGDDLDVCLMALGSEWEPFSCSHCYDNCHHHYVACLAFSSFGRIMGVCMSRGQASEPSVYFLAVAQDMEVAVQK